MMNTFSRANEALQHDLDAYTHTLCGIVAAMPQLLSLCDMIIKEARLAEALLAFASGPQLQDINQIVFHMSNLWPYREQAFARTTGFAEEIAETRRLREDALRGQRLLSKHAHDPLAAELTLCLDHIVAYLADEQRLLEECHGQIRPHTSNMDVTRKRLNLLAAALDARAPATPQQQAALHAYREAITLLCDWEGGVPLDARGVEVLERCINLLRVTDEGMLAHLNFGAAETAVN